jgi:hypothetical protein
MIEILTPLNKLERVSRKVDPTTIGPVSPGIWGEVQSNGSLEQITVNTPGTITKLIINSASDSIYESHDVEVGRITTMESIGARVKVDSEGFTGTPTQGNLMAASDKTAGLGKLFDITEKPNSEAGDYEIVARCEEYNATTGILTYRTLSPVVQNI